MESICGHNFKACNKFSTEFRSELWLGQTYSQNVHEAVCSLMFSKKLHENRSICYPGEAVDLILCEYESTLFRFLLQKSNLMLIFHIKPHSNTLRSVVGKWKSFCNGVCSYLLSVLVFFFNKWQLAALTSEIRFVSVSLIVTCTFSLGSTAGRMFLL